MEDRLKMITNTNVFIVASDKAEEFLKIDNKATKRLLAKAEILQRNKTNK